MNEKIVIERHLKLKEKLNTILSKQELYDLEQYFALHYLTKIFENQDSEIQELFYKSLLNKIN